VVNGKYSIINCISKTFIVEHGGPI